MNKIERQQSLVEHLQANGPVAVNDLAAYFQMTGATIRSDLRALERQGVVKRGYGKVEACQPEVENKPRVPEKFVSEDIAMVEKKALNLDKKVRIAQKAAALVNDGDSIILDCGSTTLRMVPELDSFTSLTMMTNSVDILLAMNELEKDHTVIMPGGTL